jgi:hypothetical protein
MSTSTDETKMITLRIPVGLKVWLEQRAKRQERSMNFVAIKLIEQAKAEQEARS